MFQRWRSWSSLTEGGLIFEPLEARHCCSTVPFSPAESPEEFQQRPSLHWQGGEGPGEPAGNHADVTFARQRLGLLGWGQTVAVVDTGIAYDHYALGGGLGSSYRVVAGWDFAEADANPYDDAPGGLHGTHVAGILGSSESAFYGVAPQVDLVALRVFDDHGGSSFAHLERALQWVYQHRNSFEFPITTVNISIGSHWNSSVVPPWAVLEDELLQLSQAGILVVASAGNDFAQDPRAGLTYPAASPYVVPVGSHNSLGQISAFSQRDRRALFAPGEWVISTAPDYLFGFNGVTDDFLQLSGTSVAAPFVSGAGILIREALQLTGASPASGQRVQQVLYDMAKDVFDPVTNATYKKLDLKSALQHVLGNDEPGTAAQPLHLGTLNASLSASGILQEVLDQDTYRFVAGQSGRVKIQLAWDGHAHQRPQVVTPAGTTTHELDLLVVAGQAYDLKVVAQGGVGRYRVNLQITGSSLPFAPSASFAESRMQWRAPTSGPRTVLAEIFSAPEVDHFTITSAAGQTLAHIQRPGSTETVSLYVSQGGLYEFSLRGRRVEARIDVVSGNRGTHDGGGMASTDVSWKMHTVSEPIVVMQPLAGATVALLASNQRLEARQRAHETPWEDRADLIQQSWNALQYDRQLQIDRLTQLLAQLNESPASQGPGLNSYGKYVDHSWEANPWDTIPASLPDVIAQSTFGVWKSRKTFLE